MITRLLSAIIGALLLAASPVLAADISVAIPVAGATLSDSSALEMQRGNTEVSLKSLISGTRALLLHMDGGNGSTTFSDSSPSPKTITRYGNAQISTAQSVFGGASGLFDGTGDYLDTPDHNDFDFGTGAWTIDFRVRFTSVANTMGLISHYGSGSPWGWVLRWVNAGSLRIVHGDNTYTDRAWSPSVDTWYHLAVTCDGSTIRMFIDGSQIGTDIAAAGTYSATATLQIGRTHTLTDDIAGYIDEVRIVKGVAKWIANFTPPAVAYSQYSTAAPTATVIKFGGQANSTFLPSTFANTSDLASEAGSVKIQYCFFDQADASDCSYNGDWLTIADFQAVADQSGKAYGRLQYQFNSNGDQDTSIADSHMTVTIPAGAGGISRGREINQ